MQALRVRSPVIPKRMRMDEERPQNIAAEISRAAESARKAASRASVEAGHSNSQHSTCLPISIERETPSKHRDCGLAILLASSLV